MIKRAFGCCELAEPVEGKMWRLAVCSCSRPLAYPDLYGNRCAPLLAVRAAALELEKTNKQASKQTKLRIPS